MFEGPIYLAAPWDHRVEARKVRDQIQAAGIEVKARWLDYSGGHMSPEAELEREALNDLADIDQARGLVVLQTKKSEGKSFEQGFFLALAQKNEITHPILVISPNGERGNVFQYLKQVYKIVQFPTEAILEMQTWKEERS